MHCPFRRLGLDAAQGAIFEDEWDEAGAATSAAATWWLSSASAAVAVRAFSQEVLFGIASVTLHRDSVDFWILVSACTWRTHWVR